MSNGNSVTCWLDGVKVGDGDDIQRLWDRRLLGRLEDPTLRAIALRKLEGRTTEEVAAELGTTRRTVDRKLRLIRALWEEEAAG